MEATGQLAKSSALHLDLGVAVELTAEAGVWPGAWIDMAGALAGSGQEPSWLLVVRPPQHRHGAQHASSRNARETFSQPEQ